METANWMDSYRAAAIGRAMKLLAWATAHRRAIVVAGSSALAGVGVAAYAIATQAPDANSLPRQVLSETLAPIDVLPQVESLAAVSLDFYRTDLTRSSDSIDTLLRRLGVNDVDAAKFLRGDINSRQLLAGRAGKMVQVRTDKLGRLGVLVGRWAPSDASLQGTHFSRLTIAREGDQLVSRLETAPLETSIRLGSGVVRSSLFAATDEARIPDGVAAQLAEVFSSDIDFRRELRKGDTFSMVYEVLTADGETVTWGPPTGKLLAAEFINNHKGFSAVWFKDAQGRGGYYDLDGRSKRRSFLASPLEFTRVTSGFALRMHPILGQWKQHNGIDFGAPMGTPVRTVADGVVEYAGWQNGYGNVVHIQHSNGRATVYAHLSKVQVRRGQRVEQGLIVGAVGATGWATGPHLHFEFKADGRPVNPAVMARNSEAIALDAASKRRFTSLAANLREQLDAADSVGHDSAAAE